MNDDKSILSLLKVLYRYYNKRDIETVCDFELQYGLLDGHETKLHLIATICEELSRFPSRPSLAIIQNSDVKNLESSIKVFLSLLGLEINWEDKNTLIESLLNELLCCRVEYRTCFRQSIHSREFAQTSIIDDDIVKSVQRIYPIKLKPENIDINSVLELLSTVSVNEYRPRLFGELSLSEDIISSLRNLSVSLSEEYEERWNLYLVRFDCLMKVFIASGNPKDGDALQTLLGVINKWRNGSFTRFRQLCIYDIYRATRDCLKVEKISSEKVAKDVMTLYRSQSKLGSEESYDSFIKKIYTPEPPNRGGIPEGFSTKKFYSKFKKR